MRHAMTLTAALATASLAPAAAQAAAIAIAGIALTGVTISAPGTPLSVGGAGTGQTQAQLAPGFVPVDIVDTTGTPFAPADAAMATLGPGPFAPENSFVIQPFSGVRSDMLFTGTTGAAQAESRPLLPQTIGFAASNYLGQGSFVIAPGGGTLSFAADVVLQAAVQTTAPLDFALAIVDLRLLGITADAVVSDYVLSSPCLLNPRLEVSGPGFTDFFCAGRVTFSTVIDQEGLFSLVLAFNAFASTFSPAPPVPAPAPLALWGLGLGALLLRTRL